MGHRILLSCCSSPLAQLTLHTLTVRVFFFFNKPKSIITFLYWNSVHVPPSMVDTKQSVDFDVPAAFRKKK